MDVTALIAERLASAVLPSGPPIIQWAGYGRSSKCDGCDLPIHAKQIEDEFDFADGRRIRLHRDCTNEWTKQRLTGCAAPCKNFKRPVGRRSS